MSDEPRLSASPLYAIARLVRAIDTAMHHEDPEVRRRAEAKCAQWRSVVQGMASGTLTVGSRTPVADTPAWVTLEVAQGGFATGRYLAEGPLLDREQALLHELRDVPGATERERLNNWFLGDAGQASIGTALKQGRLHVDVPEEAALPVVTWLLDHGYETAALDLVAELRPLMHRLRFYPELRERPRPSGAMVRVWTVGRVKQTLRSTRARPRVPTMNEALLVWAPLYDRLATLWLSTVDGEPPRVCMDVDGSPLRTEKGQPVVEGGWPCRTWPPDWAPERRAWLADYRRAAAEHERCTAHRNPRSGFARLRDALERCPEDSRALRGIDVVRIRDVLAGAAARLGEPGSAPRTTLRQQQAVMARRPLFVDLARMVAGRLDALPADGGLLEIDSVLEAAREGEHASVPRGTTMPPHLAGKLRRALEAPIDHLVELGVIGSSEVLAIVLPQITAQVAAAGIEHPDLRELYQQLYAAFRRRRSLLLLNLEHQVRIDELPWVAALAPVRQTGLDTRAQARQTLEQVTVLALSSFPQTILPNPLVREMGALAKQAGLDLPLVEEVAADIFMGTFTPKWVHAAEQAATLLHGSLYARYYDLPSPEEAARWRRSETRRWGRRTAEGFADACRTRAREAQVGKGSHVAANGTVLEQSQILTTHDLAGLTIALELGDTLRALAPSLAERCFRWIVRRQQQRAPLFKAQLQMVKNTAYAWRQGLFFLSLCDAQVQRETADRLAAMVAEQPHAWAQRFAPVVAGLRLVLDGGRFDGEGRGQAAARRFLGWSVGPHWLLARDVVRA